MNIDTEMLEAAFKCCTYALPRLIIFKAPTSYICCFFFFFFIDYVILKTRIFFLLTEIRWVVVSRTSQTKGSQKRNYIVYAALEHAVTLCHYIDVIKHGEKLCARRVNGTDNRSSSFGKKLEEGNALR